MYHIKVENPHGKEHGVKTVFVDGKEIEGNILPLFNDGKIHHVKAILG
jgi:cellobiose phosphorylase